METRPGVCANPLLTALSASVSYNCERRPLLVKRIFFHSTGRATYFCPVCFQKGLFAQTSEFITSPSRELLLQQPRRSSLAPLSALHKRLTAHERGPHHCHGLFIKLQSFSTLTCSTSLQHPLQSLEKSSHVTPSSWLHLAAQNKWKSHISGTKGVAPPGLEATIRPAPHSSPGQKMLLCLAN